MFLIDKENNRLQSLAKKSFSELGFRERQHLQEWIADKPESLGEELLIIQKEFAGFNDTNERLDLLALDKEGNIVVIENKLDDTGRDVTWQALIKYASYCSTLTKENIRSIYQSYLDKQGREVDAKERLSEFLRKEFDEIEINKGNTQRIILIAANFRKEVTSTVLWLMNYKLRLQCFKVTPYVLGDHTFLNLEQIIPTKDTEEFIISMASKTQDEIDSQETSKNRYALRREFWAQLLPQLKGKTPIFQNSSPGKDYWLSAGGTGLSGVGYNMLITRNYAGVNLELTRAEKEENKRLFDKLLEYRSEIENKFGKPLRWERSDDKISSWVGYLEYDLTIYDRQDWPKISNFLTSHIISLEETMRNNLEKLKSVLNPAGAEVEKIADR